MLKRLRDSEEGFTLIELLVVVIIIGILAAIAIPTFLNQRERGWQAELTSGLRNVALEVEAAATAEGGDYTGLEVNLDDYSAAVFGTDADGVAVESDVTIAAGTFDTAGFCIEGGHVLLDDASVPMQTYASAAGGLQDFDEAGATCP